MRWEHVARLLAVVTLVVVVTSVFASPALGCSCAMTTDVGTWVDESEAVFVGALIEKRDASPGDFGVESTYVFRVEEWVKGDLGEVIEVRSASDGAGCGFEFWSPDQRIGAAIYEQDGSLHGGLCAQMDPDVLLAAMEGPRPSSTGVGHLLVADWSSPRLTVIDDAGGHVTELSPPGVSPDTSTQLVESCPGDQRLLQLTAGEIAVWDLATLQHVGTHDISALPANMWPSDISCGDEAASEITLLISDDVGSELYEVAPNLVKVMDFEGVTGKVGGGFVISQDEYEGDATWVDLESGEKTTLTRTPVDQLVSVSVAPHPTEKRVALVQTTFREGGPVDAILSIIQHEGKRLDHFEIPGETYSPAWLDQNRVTVKAYEDGDWERPTQLIFDLGTAATFDVAGWNAEYTIADGNRLYGVTGGSILTAEVGAAGPETLVTLATQSAGTIVVLDAAPEVGPTTSAPAVDGGVTSSTVPPLVAPGLGEESPGTWGPIQWIAGGAIAVFSGILVWLALRPSRREP